MNTTAKLVARTCSKQTLRANSEIQDPEEYYRIALIISFLDHILSELDNRFNPDSFDVIKGFSVIPLVVPSRVGTKNGKATFHHSPASTNTICRCLRI